MFIFQSNRPRVRVWGNSGSKNINKISDLKLDQIYIKQKSNQCKSV